MSELSVPRRRPPLWRLFIAPVLLLVAAVAWSAFWFYSASQVDVKADAWQAREAKSGRTYQCGNRSVAGFPFRLEVRCSDVGVALVSQTAGRDKTPITARLGEILVVAQVYDPKRVIAEFKGPATIVDRSAQSTFVANWRVGRSSVAGLPATPQRASLVFDEATISRADQSVQLPLASAKHVELHGRIAEGSPTDSPMIESVLQIDQGSIRGLHPMLADPFDAAIRAMISGLKDFSPKPWPQRFREIQSVGGHVEILQFHFRQGELIATGMGTLGFSPSGHIEGELQMTVAGIERVIPALGIDRMLEDGVPQATLDQVAPGVRTQDVSKLMGALDRAVPGLGKVVKQNANAGVAAGINALGKEAVLEGRKARVFSLRFVDGVVFLGPLKVAQTPPLF